MFFFKYINWLNNKNNSLNTHGVRPIGVFAVYVESRHTAFGTVDDTTKWKNLE